MFFKHYKGRYYQSLGYVVQANNDSTMVLYTPLYECRIRFFVREYTDFIQMVSCGDTTLQRFTPVLEYELPDEARKYIISTKNVGDILASTDAQHGLLTE